MFWQYCHPLFICGSVSGEKVCTEMEGPSKNIFKSFKEDLTCYVLYYFFHLFTCFHPSSTSLDLTGASSSTVAFVILLYTVL